MSEATKAELAKLPPDLEQIKADFNLDDETLKKVVEEARREVLAKRENGDSSVPQSSLADAPTEVGGVPKTPGPSDLKFSSVETGGSNPEALRKEILQMVLNILSGNVKMDRTKTGDVHKLAQSMFE